MSAAEAVEFGEPIQDDFDLADVVCGLVADSEEEALAVRVSGELFAPDILRLEAAAKEFARGPEAGRVTAAATP